MTSPPSTTTARGRTSSWPATEPMISNGATAAATTSAVVTIGAKRSRGSTTDEVGVDGQSLAPRSCSSVLTVLRLWRTTRPKTASRPPTETSVRVLPSTPRGDNAAGESDRQAGERNRCEPPAPERDLEQEEDDRPGGHGVAEQAPLGVLARAVVAHHLGVVLEREVDLANLLLHVVRHVADIAALHAGDDIEIARDVVVLDHLGRGRHPDVGDVAEPDVTAAGPIEQEFTDVAHAVPSFGSAPHPHVEHLLLLEEAADVDPGEQRGGGAAHVARLDAEPLRSRRGRPRSRRWAPRRAS